MIYIIGNANPNISFSSQTGDVVIGYNIKNDVTKYDYIIYTPLFNLNNGLGYYSTIFNVVEKRIIASNNDQKFHTLDALSSESLVLTDTPLLNGYLLARDIYQKENKHEGLEFTNFNFSTIPSSSLHFNELDYVLKQQNYARGLIEKDANSAGISLSFRTTDSGPEKEKSFCISAQKVKIVAEITTNHFGDFEKLCRMAKKAVADGADYVKIQKRDINSFYSKQALRKSYDSPFGTTFYDYRKQLELSLDEIREFDRFCKSNNITWFASILDSVSFDRLQEFSPSILKLPSTISNNRAYIEKALCEFNGDIVVSTGMTDESYQDFLLKHKNPSSKLYLLQCNSAYPTPNHDCNLRVINHYRELAKRFDFVIPGYSSHDYGSLGCMLAVAAGALMIEKHVKEGDANWAHFDDVALDLDKGEFAQFVQNIRHAEVYLGTESKSITASEHHKYVIPNHNSGEN